jgi:Tfp pilus assembly protein PilF
MKISSGLLVLALTLLTGCVTQPQQPVGLLDVISRPAERALQSGLRAYEDAAYPEAEKQLKLAIQGGLVSPRDQAAAQKVLAFIYCTSNRIADCENAFKAARAVDPAFALTRSEAGHPVWGPVYKRVQPAQ